LISPSWIYSCSSEYPSFKFCNLLKVLKKKKKKKKKKKLKKKKKKKKRKKKKKVIRDKHYFGVHLEFGRHFEI
jgi:hypothetical protein